VLGSGCSDVASRVPARGRLLGQWATRNLQRQRPPQRAAFDHASRRFEWRDQSRPRSPRLSVAETLTRPLPAPREVRYGSLGSW